MGKKMLCGSLRCFLCLLLLIFLAGSCYEVWLFPSVEADPVHFAWGDPFRRTEGQEPSYLEATGVYKARVGGCEVAAYGMEQSEMYMKGLFSMEQLRENLDEKLVDCLARHGRASQEMLFEAVVPGFARTSAWLVQSGANPFLPLKQPALPFLDKLAADLSWYRGHAQRTFSFAGPAFYLSPHLWTAVDGKSAVQIALQGGFSNIARLFGSGAGSVVDDWNRTVQDYISAAGSAVMASEALENFPGVFARKHTVEVPAPLEVSCPGRQGLGWTRRSSFPSYGRCDFDVVTSLSREQYLRDYGSMGRPVMIRQFISAEDRCKLERAVLLKQNQQVKFKVGAIAYPNLHGNIAWCQPSQSLETLESGKNCSESIDTPAYYAHIVSADEKPFDLIQSNTWARLQALLDLKDSDLEIAQHFMGGDGSGAQMHYHMAAANLLYVGLKDWYLTSPRHTALSSIPAGKLWRRKGTNMEHVLRCTQHAGDVLLLPDAWGHSTLSHGFSAGLGIIYGLGYGQAKVHSGTAQARTMQ